jgi:uncharacterized surface protein with fasciclin (FAS1) repeats
MRTARSALLATAVVLAALAATATGCSGGGADATSGPSSPGASGPSSPGASGPSSPGAPFGPACARLPAAGPGSPADLADRPLAGAVATSPLLTTLARAVQDANLVDTLNSAAGVTLLAPADAAFDAVPPATLGPLLADGPELTRLLTHHVLRGRLAPAQLAGQHTTLAGDRVTITGSGQQFSVAADRTLSGAGPATVVCGGLRTAGATVYVIDQVLQPGG